jgi:ryanodine receptor 2
MTYKPTPLDTDRVLIPPELLALTERLAEHAHEVWAAQRLASGWTYGPQRNDPAKQHPCLVPYRELPESEKEYDRQAALGTIRAILALGYTIRKPRPEPARVSNERPPRPPRQARPAPDPSRPEP